MGNYLKVFFVDFHDVAMKDKIVTQHIIWHFTDDFENWRINPNLIKEIKSSASDKTIPDSGFILKINNTTEALFEFVMLDSTKTSNHQNFFGYKITYRAISENQTNTTQNNTNLTNNTNNAPLDEISNQTTIKTTENKITDENKANDSVSLEKDNSEKNAFKSVNLKKNVSGNSIIGIILLSILSCFIAVKYVRD